MKNLPLEGFEPSIPYGHRILSAARIPVPTQRRRTLYFTAWTASVNFSDAKPKQRKT